MKDALVLVDWLQAWADDNRQVIPMPPPTVDRWLCRSALHKAIRRGQTDRALYRAGQLWRIDPDYTWRALATISAEDVGFPVESGDAEPVLAAHLAQLKTLRVKLVPNETRLLTAVVSRLCARPKTRASAELYAVAAVENAEWLKSISLATPDELLQMWQEGDAAVAAGVLLVGRGWVKGRPVDKQLVEQFCMRFRDEWPGVVGEMAAQCFLRPAAEVSVVLPAAMRLRGGVAGVGHTEFDSRWVGEWPAEALDLYNRVGRLALRAYFTSLSKDYPEMKEVPAQNRVTALGEAVFFEEGGIVDPVYTGPEMVDLTKHKNRAILEALGVPEQLGLRLREIVRQEWPRLQQKREWALGIS